MEKISGSNTESYKNKDIFKKQPFVIFYHLSTVIKMVPCYFSNFFLLKEFL